MTTKRAQQHKWLVRYEKMYHHGAGIHSKWRYKVRQVNMRRAEIAESEYERRKRERENPELARKVNEILYMEVSNGN